MNVDCAIVYLLAMNFQIRQHFESLSAVVKLAEVNVRLVVISHRVFFEIHEFFEASCALGHVAVEDSDL